MRTRNPLPLFAALILGFAGSPALAETPRYSVAATADIGGMPSDPAVVVGPLAGERAADAQLDASPTEWPSYNRTLAGTAHSAASARIGVLGAEIAAIGDPRNSTQFPTYGPGGWTQARFTDSAVVASELPAGTPVTLTFRVAATGDRSGTGNYTGSSSCALWAGGVGASSVWNFTSKTQPSSPPAPAITLQSAVGTRLPLSGTLTVSASVVWLMQGSPFIGGEVAANGGCELVLESASAPVWLVADSGHDYGTPAL